MAKPSLAHPAPQVQGGKRTSKRGRGFGNASPVCGLEAEADILVKTVVRCCETPEFYRLYGCPHGRGPRGER